MLRQRKNNFFYWNLTYFCQDIPLPKGDVSWQKSVFLQDVINSLRQQSSHSGFNLPWRKIQTKEMTFWVEDSFCIFSCNYGSAAVVKFRSTRARPFNEHCLYYLHFYNLHLCSNLNFLFFVVLMFQRHRCAEHLSRQCRLREARRLRSVEIHRAWGILQR